MPCELVVANTGPFDGEEIDGLDVDDDQKRRFLEDVKKEDKGPEPMDEDDEDDLDLV